MRAKVIFVGISAAFGIAMLSGPGSADVMVPTSARPVVVELFTSQGCSSCPPADAFMESLARDPGIVAITRPVTYWDRLGWKDTLAREANTRQQQTYAAQGGTGSGVYTPQMMVAGRFGVVGSERQSVQGLIQRSRDSKAPAIAVRPNVVAVSGTVGGPADVVVVGLRSNVSVRIGAGENGGRAVRYSNIYVGERKIGRWTGGTQTFPVSANDLQFSGADRYAVILQQSNSGPILGGRYF